MKTTPVMRLLNQLGLFQLNHSGKVDPTRPLPKPPPPIPTMKRSKNDPRQLTLQLSFTNPTPAVLRNLALLMEVAEGSEASGDTAGIHHSDGKASDIANRKALPDQKVLRDRLRQLAGCAAIARKKEWHEVWVLAYHEFYKRTNRHPVTESVRLGLPTHLDYVFTDPSWPGILHDVLDGMLLEKETPA